MANEAAKYFSDIYTATENNLQVLSWFNVADGADGLALNMARRWRVAVHFFRGNTLPTYGINKIFTPKILFYELSGNQFKACRRSLLIISFRQAFLGTLQWENLDRNAVGANVIAAC